MGIKRQRLSSIGESGYVHSQKENAHLSLLPSVLANYRKQTHMVGNLGGGSKTQRGSRLSMIGGNAKLGTVYIAMM